MELVKCFIQLWDQEFVLTPQVYISVFGSNGPAGNGHSAKYLSRHLVQDLTVLKGTGFAFVGITYNIFYRLFFLGSKSPLQSGGESGSSTSFQVRFKYLLTNIIRIHLHDLLQVHPCIRSFRK